MVKTILDYNTVELDKDDNSVIIIDQTLLPGRTELIRLKTAQEIWDAIYLLKVRGAPAIGVAARHSIRQTRLTPFIRSLRRIKNTLILRAQLPLIFPGL